MIQTSCLVEGYTTEALYHSTRLDPRSGFTNDKTDKFLSLLTAAKPHLRPCPYLGRYSVTGLSRERHANSRPNGGAHVGSDTETSITQCNDLQFQSLTVGCTEVNTMQFHSSCSVAETSSKFSKPLLLVKSFKFLSCQAKNIRQCIMC